MQWLNYICLSYLVKSLLATSSFRSHDTDEWWSWLQIQIPSSIFQFIYINNPFKFTPKRKALLYVFISEFHPSSYINFFSFESPIFLQISKGKKLMLQATVLSQKLQLQLLQLQQSHHHVNSWWHFLHPKLPCFLNFGTIFFVLSYINKLSSKSCVDAGKTGWLVWFCL